MEDDEEDVTINQEAEKLLWVEKFAPRTYTDLLSEEVGWERKKGVGKGGQKRGEGGFRDCVCRISGKVRLLDLERCRVCQIKKKG